MNRSRSARKGCDPDEARRRRGETSIKLRKQKQLESMTKRRNVEISASAGVPGDVANNAEASTAANPDNTPSIPVLMNTLQNGEGEAQVEALRGFRRLLSHESNPPVKDCIAVGAIPLFVQALQCGDRPDLMFEAAWALTNIASTDFTNIVVENGAVPFLAQALLSGCPNVREQAGWCLGNIAGDGSASRDVCLNAGALPNLVENIKQPANESLLRNCTWALANFCRGKPHPSSDHVRPAIPILTQLVQHSDAEVVIDACWALSYLSDGNDERIDEVARSGCIPALVKLLQSDTPTMVVPALRTLGNIVSGSDVQTQAVIDAGVLVVLSPLLAHYKKNIRKEACWMLSNIAAGTSEQLDSVMRTDGIIPAVLNQLATSAEWDVRKEASWVISNMATGGTTAHVSKLVEHGAIRPLCDLLDVGEARILMVALDALDAILRSGNNNVVYLQLIDEASGVEKIENLQEHERDEIYQKSVSMIENYFGGEDCDNEAENLAPTQSNDNASFSFGMSSTIGNSSNNNTNVFKFGAGAIEDKGSFGQPINGNAVNIAPSNGNFATFGQQYQF